MKQIFMLLSLVFISNNSFANNTMSMGEKLNIGNTIDTYLECASFYSILSQGFKNNKEAQSNLEKQSTIFIAYSTILGEYINIKDEAITSKYNMFIKNQMKEIDKDLINISILNVRLLDLCSNLFKDPTKPLLSIYNK